MHVVIAYDKQMRGIKDEWPTIVHGCPPDTLYITHYYKTDLQRSGRSASLHNVKRKLLTDWPQLPEVF